MIFIFISNFKFQFKYLSKGTSMDKGKSYTIKEKIYIIHTLKTSVKQADKISFFSNFALSLFMYLSMVSRAIR